MPVDTDEFIGREALITEFNRLFSYRRQQNAIYFAADGGMGKSRLLSKLKRICDQVPYRAVPELINFADLSNRSIKGLRDTIVQRLESIGDEKPQLTIYRQCKEDLERAEAEGETTRDLPGIAALQKKVDNAFFKYFPQATRGQQVVLMFDTFEVAQNKIVGRWFVEEFLPRSDNAIIVIAGRRQPMAMALPFQVIRQEVTAWTESDVARYLIGKNRDNYDDLFQKIYSSTEGNPLFVEMINSNWDLMLKLLVKPGKNALTQKDFEEAFLDLIKPPPTTPNTPNLSEDARAFIGFIGIAKRRFRFDMVPTEIAKIDTKKLAEELKRQPFIKSLPADTNDINATVFTLHDRVQDMVEKNEVVSIWREEHRDAFESIQTWYDIQIGGDVSDITSNDKATKRLQHHVLLAEQFGNDLDKLLGKDDVNAAIETYSKLMGEAQKNGEIDLIELIWDEWFGHPKVPNAAYEQCRELADWFKNNGFYSQAEYLISLLVVFFTNPTNKHVPDEIRSDAIDLEYCYQCLLAECQMALGKFDEAQKALEAGLKQSSEKDEFGFRPSLLMLMGNWYTAMGDWDEALKQYEKALIDSQFLLQSAEKRREIYATIYISQAKVYSLKGDYVDAVNSCKNASEIAPPKLYANVALELGRVHRYAGREDKARDCFEEALSLSQVEDQYRVSALEGLGITLSRIGREQIQANPLNDSKLQHEALRRLLEAFDISMRQNIASRLPSILRRLGYIFWELGKLERIAKYSSSNSDQQHNNLVGSLTATIEEVKARFSDLPLEEEFKGELANPASFKELKMFGRAQRLFEVSALEANRLSDYQTSLTALINAADVARENGSESEVRYYVENSIPSLKNYTRRYDLFHALGEVVLADLALEQGNYNDAVYGYALYYPIIVKQGGYGQYLVMSKFDDLLSRLEKLNPKDIITIGSQLIDAWKETDGIVKSFVGRLQGQVRKASLV